VVSREKDNTEAYLKLSLVPAALRRY